MKKIDTALPYQCMTNAKLYIILSCNKKIDFFLAFIIHYEQFLTKFALFKQVKYISKQQKTYNHAKNPTDSHTLDGCRQYQRTKAL